MPILEVKNLMVKYGNGVVVDDVSFSVAAGDFVCVTGPNGAGKTTLLKAMLGLIPTFGGSVSFFGSPLGISSNRNRIGYLPQKNVGINRLFPATAEEVVLLGALASKPFPKRATEADRKRARETLVSFGGEDFFDRSFIELSGGQQQKTLLARALVGKPELLILDEPSTALDPESRAEFFTLVERLNKQNAVAVLIVTHDMDYVGRYANTMLVLDRRVEYFGTAETFLHRHHITHHHDYECI